MSTNLRPASTRTLTIASGQSLSGPIELKRVATGLVLPDAWDAAGLSFQVSFDDETWHDLYDEDGELTIGSHAVSAGCALALPLHALVNAAHLRVRSGTSGSPVAQSADRAITVIERQVD